jgi:hypothetical protein
MTTAKYKKLSRHLSWDTEEHIIDGLWTEIWRWNFMSAEHLAATINKRLWYSPKKKAWCTSKAVWTLCVCVCVCMHLMIVPCLLHLISKFDDCHTDKTFLLSTHKVCYSWSDLFGISWRSIHAILCNTKREKLKTNFRNKIFMRFFRVRRGCLHFLFHSTEILMQVGKRLLTFSFKL